MEPTLGAGPSHQPAPERWALVWEGHDSLADLTEKMLVEHGIDFARGIGAAGKVEIRVPWEHEETARELIREWAV